MRYMYYIGVLFLIFSGVFLYTHLSMKPPPEGDVAIKINDRLITKEEFAELTKERYPRELTEKELINSIIEKELLIQEAKRLGIDREDPFRKSIQNFYEQSLIKILLERKFSGLEPEVTDDDVRAYAFLTGKRISLELRTAGRPEDLENRKTEKKEEEVDFIDLSRHLQVLLLDMKPGDERGPLFLGGEYLLVKVKAITDNPSPPEPPEEELIRRIIRQSKKELTIAEWIGKLRKSARIEVFLDGEGKTERKGEE